MTFGGIGVQAVARRARTAQTQKSIQRSANSIGVLETCGLSGKSRIAGAPPASN